MGPAAEISPQDRFVTNITSIFLQDCLNVFGDRRSATSTVDTSKTWSLADPSTPSSIRLGLHQGVRKVLACLRLALLCLPLQRLIQSAKDVNTTTMPVTALVAREIGHASLFYSWNRNARYDNGLHLTREAHETCSQCYGQTLATRDGDWWLILV